MKNLWYITFLLVFLSGSLSLKGQQLVTRWHDADSTKPKERFYVTDQGTLDGKYIAYFENGNKKMEGSYKGNVPTGEWDYFFENGRLRMRGQMGAGGSAEWTYYYENGAHKMKGTTVNGKRQGQWTFYYENGIEHKTGLYLDGEKRGTWKHYYESGHLKSQTVYEPEGALHREFFENGKRKAEGKLVDGKPQGVWKYYDEEGKLVAEGGEQNGNREGNWKFYYPDGKVATEGNYVAGQKDGLWKTYHQNGNVASEGNMEDGQMQGSWKLFHENGAFKGETQYSNGNGEYKEYYANGKLKVEGRLKNGEKEGSWTYYSKDGTVEGKCDYANGAGHYKAFYKDGTVKQEGPMEGDKRVGRWTLYNEKGEVAGHLVMLDQEGDAPLLDPENQTNTLEADSTQSAGNEEKKEDKKSVKRPSGKRSGLRLNIRSHFVKRRNEFRGLILSFNPLGLVRNQMPVTLEYYIQDRLGYALTYRLHRGPFFQVASDIPEDKVYSRGHSISVDQRLYTLKKRPYRDQKGQLFYFAHQLRYRQLSYFVKATMEQDKAIPRLDEYSVEYAWKVGIRLLGPVSEPGFTFDINIGGGVGYRYQEEQFVKTKSSQDLFKNVADEPFYLTPRFELGFGYLF